jgi:hypothetical protein
MKWQYYEFGFILLSFESPKLHMQNMHTTTKCVPIHQMLSLDFD